MKIALVHDYLLEYGGAERVLRKLADMYPEAPIYTAFVSEGSRAASAFSDRKLYESKYGWILKRFRLYSPLRFLIPKIWKSIDLSGYDLVITSCSGYVARGFKKSKKTRVIAYCHTPPRWLYGYETPTGAGGRWWGRAYMWIVGPFVRYFDYVSAQDVDEWVVNSENVGRRVGKFYRKEAMVVYPPVEVKRLNRESREFTKQDYYLIVSRLVGAKGIEEAVEAASRLGIKLMIAGTGEGYVDVRKSVEKVASSNVELLGWVGERELVKLYSEAKGFVALARDEDFGMTVVEAQACGTPVIAYRGGGFLETVKEGETGMFVNDVDDLDEVIKKFEKKKWDRVKIKKWVMKFDEREFEYRIRKIVGS